MCYPRTCSTCSKTTWGGCGQHIDSVMDSVPTAQRCTCDGAADRPGFFKSLLRR